MSDAYLQVELDDAINKVLVVNTHKGLLRYNRLSFGPESAPAIFHKLLDNLVFCSPYMAAYLDDPIVAGRLNEGHLQHIKPVISALNQYDMKPGFELG